MNEETKTNKIIEIKNNESSIKNIDETKIIKINDETKVNQDKNIEINFNNAHLFTNILKLNINESIDNSSKENSLNSSAIILNEELISITNLSDFSNLSETKNSLLNSDINTIDDISNITNTTTNQKNKKKRKNNEILDPNLIEKRQ